MSLVMLSSIASLCSLKYTDTDVAVNKQQYAKDFLLYNCNLQELAKLTWPWDYLNDMS